MPYKDPTNYTLITYAWITVLACWGGVVNFIGKIKRGDTKPFNITELIGEMVTSAFSGLITFYLCELSMTPPLLTAVLVAISGHMGARAIFMIEKAFASKFKSLD